MHVEESQNHFKLELKWKKVGKKNWEKSWTKSLDKKLEKSWQKKLEKVGNRSWQKKLKKVGKKIGKKVGKIEKSFQKLKKVGTVIWESGGTSLSTNSPSRAGRFHLGTCQAQKLKKKVGKKLGWMLKKVVKKLEAS